MLWSYVLGLSSGRGEAPKGCGGGYGGGGDPCCVQRTVCGRQEIRPHFAEKMALLQKFKISAHPREMIFFDMVRLEKQWRWFPFQ